MPVFGVILVCIFPHSDRIRRDAKYLSVKKIRSKKIRSRITPSTDPFHAKYDSSISVNFPSIKPVFSMSETILRYTLEPPVM